MLKLKDIYALPAKKLSFQSWDSVSLRSDWFPEISGLEWGLTDAVRAALDAEGRFETREVGYHQADHRRFAFMGTLWFDGHPVVIVQNGGREGDDHKARWITDRERFFALCAYLQSKLEPDVADQDIYDPETAVYEDDLLCFYGQDFGTSLGYPPEPKVDGFMLLQLRDLGHHLAAADLSENRIFIAVKPEVPEVAPYLRRGSYLMRQTREAVAEDFTPEAPVYPYLKEQGYTRFYWYQPCVSHPADEKVISM